MPTVTAHEPASVIPSHRMNGIQIISLLADSEEQYYESVMRDEGKTRTTMICNTVDRKADSRAKVSPEGKHRRVLRSIKQRQTSNTNILRDCLPAKLRGTRARDSTSN